MEKTANCPVDGKRRLRIKDPARRRWLAAKRAERFARFLRNLSPNGGQK